MTTQPRADMNVTSLVDVCLVLLIIFLVVTPLIEAGRAELRRRSLPAPGRPGRPVRG